MKVQEQVATAERRVESTSRSRTQEEGSHRRRQTEIHGDDLGLYVLNSVVDRQPCDHRPSWAVDVEIDGLVGIFVI